MKPTLLIFILLLSFSSVQAQEWKYYKYENLEFKSKFPAEPEKTVQKVQTAVGELDMHMIMYSPDSGDDNAVYTIIRSDYPEDYFTDADDTQYKEVLDGAVKGAVSNVNGTIVFEKELKFNGFPARNIKIKITEGFIYINAVLVHNKMFIAQVICLSENDHNSSIQKFLNSFEIIKTNK